MSVQVLGKTIQQDLYNKYLAQSRTVNSNVQIANISTNNDGSIQITEEDGDTFNISAGGTVTNVTNNAPATAATTATTTTAATTAATETNADVETIKNKIQDLQGQVKQKTAQKAFNEQQIEALDKQLKSLEEQIKKEIEDAVKEAEEISEQHGEAVNAIVQDELDAYTQAQGQMSYSDFQASLSSKITSINSSDAQKLASVTLKIVNANTKMASLEGNLNKMKSLVEANKQLDTEIGTLNGQIEGLNVQLQEAEKANNEAATKKCDPIGFTSDGVRYDFMIDSDANGKLSNENEFLGAGKNWDEMIALDTNKDGKVTSDELQNGNIKMVVTDANGNQSVQDVANIFDNDDFINLSSYNSVNEDMCNNNTLLGTFSLTMKDKNINNAYNTLDDLTWLDEHYNFSDKADGLGRFGDTLTLTAKASTLDTTQAITEHETALQELKQSITGAWRALGYNEALLTQVSNIARSESTTTAQALRTEFQAMARQTAQEQAKQEVEAKGDENGLVDGKTEAEIAAQIEDQLLADN